MHRTQWSRQANKSGEIMGFVIRNPTSIAPPGGRYSHAIELPATARLVFASGQVGVDKNGKPGATIEKQCELAWKNVMAILKDARMGPGDLVRIQVFLTDPRFIPVYRAARDKFIDAVPPASTLLIVSALADPAFMVEIEAIAAKA
jgi:enamine deaminase RidA (YjgF/YER057c/UK114 family)